VLVVLQSRARPLLLLIPAVGTVLSKVTVALAVDEHPLDPVTVTVYVPAAVALYAAELPTTFVPSDQEYVPPPVAVRVVLVVVQFSARPLLLIPADGAALFCVIVVLAVEVEHPLAPATVTV
jgi:hypothetical protein